MTHMNDQMTFEEFLAQLPTLDWYYNMSDDPSAYRRGEQRWRFYHDLAKEKGPEWYAAFEAEWDRHPIR